ncbi:HEXXH motif domain-containing protein [Actinomadura madurae]|uniref:HEXXH motif domain-containing protein n=1 Tax=Actinomadura madurae TaxID=1993 RepID=UPI002025EC85|nr:HEXXH motif domain-containing protein [Actinomadura madurae]URN09289.1 HEXXH motif domain-containing protein [Actinomadura madurae]
MPAEATLLGLARGGGGEMAVQELRGAHLGRCMTLLRAVREAAEASAHPEAGMAAAGWTLLAALDRSHPDAVREVLAYPTVAVWARRTLTELARARASHPGRLACAAAVAAHRAGRDRAIQLPAEDGAVVLPGLGRAVMRGAATARSRAGRVGDVLLEDGQPGWAPLRSLEAGHGDARVRFVLEDVDPDRMPGAATVTGRLDDHTVERWRDVLAQAWDLLVTLHWTTAAEVSTAITALTPLRASGNGHHSATPLHAFGNIGLSTPPGAHELADSLAHEIQHTKLSALLETVVLTLPDDGTRYYAPWRPDPRPLAGLLQGAYAYLGVTGFWRRQRDAERGERALRAHSEFARWREAAFAATRTLAGSGRLTEEGAVFVAEMGRTLRAWRRESVPSAALRRARAIAGEHRRSWRDRNPSR